MTYEEFKQLAEHPQHRDVPAIFKLEVLETEELEEKSKRNRTSKTASISKRTMAASETRSYCRNRRSAVASTVEGYSCRPKSPTMSPTRNRPPFVPTATSIP